jgi:superfamily II DNA or RNA helicase/DNA-binding transcriptional ArsR family regulator
MDGQLVHPDEASEIQAFLEATRELEDARILEEAEFIRDLDLAENEEPGEGGDELQDAPASIIEDAQARRTYWQAQGLVELEQAAFAAALGENHAEHQRSAYFRLAVYHGRTVSILRSALRDGKEALAQAAMRNLATLHRAMMQMHRQAPDSAPVALVLDRPGRDELARDLVLRALQESTEPLDLDTVVQRANDLDILGVAKGTVQRHLKDLAAAGYVDVVGQRPARYTRSPRSYTDMDVDTPSLRALVGPALHTLLAAEGYGGLSDVAGRQGAFRAAFVRLAGLGPTSAALFVDLVGTLREGRAREVSPWSHADLIGSPYPRPYQYEAYAVFRGYGYHGQLVEAPTGSGKTMIGMMCVQDWLQSLRAGQSILILVPTSNYLQQWSGELCYKPIGLRLSPEMVFAGTPGQLERFQKRTGSHPAILLMTYTALAQAGSAIGKGGFDVDSIEMFLQGANVQHVILDEVHKVAENLKSVSSDVIRLMLDWLNDGSLQGLIGFTGTAEAYRSRFARLGLDLVYTIPIDELIAAGFVAPFAELGAPFAYSARERRIRDLLDAYKAGTSRFMELVGGERLRAWFAGLPMTERMVIGHDLLNMYSGRKDWTTALPTRLAQWERGGSLQLTETRLVSTVQIAHGWSDTDMVRAAGADWDAFAQLVVELDEIKAELAELIYLPSTLKRLQMPGFAARFAAGAMRQAHAEASNQAARGEAVKDGLATTIVGLYEALSEWYRRVGEGRVETIKAVIEAERATRPVSGIIIFDNARRIQWKQGLATPGYEGLGGLYAQLLGDARFTPYAVLSGEQYLPHDEADPLPPRIAAFVEESLMRGEIATAMFDLVFQGLDLPEATRLLLRTRWHELIEAYIPRLSNVHAARPGDFSRQVLRPIRRSIRDLSLGAASARVLARLDLRNIHFADLVTTFFDYAIIARYFRQARVAELEQVSGAQQKFFVVPMSSGSRKLLMYDLTARIVDAESLPINLVVVSTWARTGWNVISPNVLIDATATRDVTAWQQLRGRAIRARRSWTNDCYRLITALIGSQMQSPLAQADMPDDVAETLALTRGDEQVGEVTLDARLQALLAEVAPEPVQARVEAQGISALTDQERSAIAIALMRQRNKVTHIFELVKAYGATSQVQYDRTERAWQRRENIAAKHAYEVAVNPFSGNKLAGDGHAPLVYAQDPRADLPAELQERLADAIDESDDRIVAGWLQYGGLSEPGAMYGE